MYANKELSIVNSCKDHQIEIFCSVFCILKVDFLIKYFLHHMV